MTATITSGYGLERGVEMRVEGVVGDGYYGGLNSKKKVLSQWHSVERLMAVASGGLVIVNTAPLYSQLVAL